MQTKQKRRRSTAKKLKSSTTSPSMMSLALDVGFLKKQIACLHKKEKKDEGNQKEEQVCKKDDPDCSIIMKLATSREQVLPQEDNKTLKKVRMKKEQCEPLLQVKIPHFDYQLSLNIQFNKLYQQMRQVGGNSLVRTLNSAIQTINLCVQKFTPFQKRGNAQKLQNMLREQKMKNLELEKQIKRMKESLVLKSQDWNRKSMKQIEQIEHLTKQIKTNSYRCIELMQQNSSLTEQMKIFQEVIEQKEEQILLLQTLLNNKTNGEMTRRQLNSPLVSQVKQIRIKNIDGIQ